MGAETLARWERRIRPFVGKLPPKLAVSRYSRGRLAFLAQFEKDIPEESYTPSAHMERLLWGIRFRAPFMNAAGMFKNGECFETVFRQGAGAYLGGTTTWNPRAGNTKEGIRLPFVPYPNSGAASNWLGLPNDGDRVNVLRVAELAQIAEIPIGWSVMGSPDFGNEKKLTHLVHSMRLYERAGIDFLELNESCPNTTRGRPEENGAAFRLRYVKKHFLDRRTRRLPVIVKPSNDTDPRELPAFLDFLFKLGFDGVNLGNTSTDYDRMREKIALSERRLFDFYTKTFGGGVSGAPLREVSLELASRAVEYVRQGPPQQEFHVIRTGGVASREDFRQSEEAGISLTQWHTGYFENFAVHGHRLYRHIFEGAG